MELSSNKIVDFQCVHVSQAGNSNNMEKKGIFMLLEKMKEVPNQSPLTVMYR